MNVVPCVPVVSSMPLGVVTAPNFSLTPVMERVKLDHPEWGVVKLSVIEAEYRSFLAMCKAYPRRNVRPTKDIDEVWHSHILHTRKYHADCDAYFGYYLHHRPLASGTVMEGERMTLDMQAREAAGLGLCCRGYCDPDVQDQRDSPRATLSS